MKLKTPILLAAILSATSGLALAGVSADEARQLGNTLTSIGAEKAATRTARFPPTRAA
jgi:folylpolyglutamate synthase/dihydropteroate synthase